MELFPLKTKMAVKILEKQLTTPSGLVLANTDKDEVTKGEVIAIGPDVEDIRVGDIIMADWNQAQDTEHGRDDCKVVIIKEEHVVAVFDQSSL
jgi:co-chaperonin GroES (HSP10)